MKKITFTIILIFSITHFWASGARAQDLSNDPGAYMNAVSGAELPMNKSYMAYISASAHSSRKRKIERMREKVLNDIAVCLGTISYLPPFKGDNSFKDQHMKYIQMCSKVFNQDYAHLVDMDDIAERSYDEMQAYLLLMQATNDTLQRAINRVQIADHAFAKKYNVNIVNQQTELSEKMEATGRMNKYHDKVYLLFYKCNWTDGQLTKAVNEKNVNKIEQNRSALSRYATEGLAVLDSLKAFDNDASLAQACKDALHFYKQEADTQASHITDFFLKEENFQKLKTSMEAKAANQRTQQDVDTYNKAVADMNAMVAVYNQTNNDMNNGRAQINNEWMNTEKAFIDMHTPYYK